MDSQYAERYRELYQQHWWWRARERAVEQRVRRLVLPQPARILDIGCGDALFFDRLGSFGEVEGLEADESLVSAATRARRRIYLQPFDRSFQPPHRYHLLLLLDVLEHLPDPDQALQHAYSLLEPGGHLVVTVPALRGLWTSHDDFNQHRTRYHAGELRAELERAGFMVADLRPLFLWPVLGKLMVRLKERFAVLPPKPVALPPRWLNRMLYQVTRVDLALGLALRLPLGSSLMAIGSVPTAAP